MLKNYPGPESVVVGRQFDIFVNFLSSCKCVLPEFRALAFFSARWPAFPPLFVDTLPMGANSCTSILCFDGLKFYGDEVTGRKCEFCPSFRLVMLSKYQLAVRSHTDSILRRGARGVWTWGLVSPQEPATATLLPACECVWWYPFWARSDYGSRGPLVAHLSPPVRVGDAAGPAPMPP